MSLSGMTVVMLWLIAGMLPTPGAIADSPQESIETILEEMALDLNHIRAAFPHDFPEIARIAQRIANHPKPSRAARWHMLRCAGPRQGLALGKQNAAIRDLAEQLAASVTAAEIASARQTFAQLEVTFRQWHADYQRVQASCQD